MNRISLEVPLRRFLSELEENYPGLSVTAVIAAAAGEFSDHLPKDPIDRLIAATPLCGGHALITADWQILSSKVCRLIW